MLIIRIGNTYATLKDNSIPVVLRSPLFFDESKNGSYLFNFAVILTDELRKELGYVNRPASTQKVFRRNIEIRLGEFMFTALSTIKAVNDNEVEFFMPAKNGVLANIQKKIRLRDVDSGGERKSYQYYADAIAERIDVDFVSNFDRVRMLPMPFPRINNDDDELFNEGGASFVPPQSGTWYLFFNLIVVGSQYQDMKLEILQNGIVIETLQMGKENANAFFTETGTKQILVKTSLRFNQTVSFRLTSQTVWDFDRWVQKYIVFRESSVMIFKNINFTSFTANYYPGSDFSIFPIYNNQFFENAPAARFSIDEQDFDFLNKKFPVLNYFVDGVFAPTISGNDGTDYFSMINTMIPFPYIPAVVKWILQKTNTTVVGSNPFESDTLKNLCCVSMNSINIFDQSAINKFRQKYNLSNLLPDIDMATFFSNICKTLGIVFQYNATDNNISFKVLNDIFNDHTSVPFSHNIIQKPQLSAQQYDGYRVFFNSAGDKFIDENVKPLSDVNYKGPVATLADLPETGNETNDCYLVTELNEYYNYEYNKETGFMDWIFYSLNFLIERKVQFDPEAEDPEFFEYELPISPAMMWPTSNQQDQQFGAPAREWLIPVCNRAGFFYGLPEPEPQYSLLFFRGWKRDSNNENYPLGTNDTKDYAGNSATDHPLSLRIDDDPNGLWENHLKQFIEWRAKTEGPYTITKLMTPKELASTDFLRWHNIIGIDYMIKEMRFNLTDSARVSVEVDLVSRLTK